MIENPKVAVKRRYTEYELRKLLPGYSKNNYDAELLVSRVDIAIKNEKAFCEDIWQLRDKVGSNLGDLITALRTIEERT